MNIVLGASGQVGSAIVDQLLKEKAPLKAVIRDAEKAGQFKEKGVVVEIADAFDESALKAAFKDGSTVFILTPETAQSNDVIGDTKTILANYRGAIESSPIKKVVGLSSMGAQYRAGNLEMSYLLEHAFTGTNVQQIFVRPAYYYSNWMPYLPTVKEQGILPSFYPVDLKIPMSSPLDIAKFVAEVMIKPVDGSPIYEVEGPDWYSSNDIAGIFSDALGRKVEARQTPKEDWKAQLQKLGFTEDAVKNFIEMTEIVNAGKAKPEGNGTVSVKTKTTFKEYLANTVA